MFGLVEDRACWIRMSASACSLLQYPRSGSLRKSPLDGSSWGNELERPNVPRRHQLSGPHLGKCCLFLAGDLHPSGINLLTCLIAVDRLSPCVLHAPGRPGPRVTRSSKGPSRSCSFQARPEDGDVAPRLPLGLLFLESRSGRGCSLDPRFKALGKAGEHAAEDSSCGKAPLISAEDFSLS